jgi:Predicted Zn peptidase
MNYHHRNDNTLENIARNIIVKYDPTLLHTPAPIPVEAIMEQVYGLTIVFHSIRKNGRILGETIFEDCMVPIYEHRNNEGYKLAPFKAGTVIIDSSLIDNRKDGRYNWTCCHELSHYVLDKQYFMELGETAAMTKSTRSSETGRKIEHQANRLTNYLLMPKGTVKSAFYQHRLAGNVTAILADIFRVSCEAMGYRLKEMGLI